MARKLDPVPATYSKPFFDTMVGKLNNTIATLEQQTQNPFIIGTGAPTANIGTAGSVYLDKASGMFYGPKGSNGWPGGFSI